MGGTIVSPSPESSPEAVDSDPPSELPAVDTNVTNNEEPRTEFESSQDQEVESKPEDVAKETPSEDAVDSVESTEGPPAADDIPASDDVQEDDQATCGDEDSKEAAGVTVSGSTEGGSNGMGAQD